MSEKKSVEPTAGPQSVAQTLEEATASEYKYGFVSDIDTETIPPGLSEDVIRYISRKKG